jgi:methionine-gamma-lyase
MEENITDRNDMQNGKRGFSTRSIHHGYDPYSGVGSLNPPVYMTSTFAFPSVEEGAARFSGEQPGYIYGRLGNPTTALLESRLADLEGAEAAVVTASGQGATTTLLYTILERGHELIVDQTLYGCTYAFLHRGLAKMDIRVKHVDLTDPAALVSAVGPETKGIFFETPANPNLRVVDIRAISRIAKARGLWVAVDNTYATPYLQRPIELGADYVVHSATKYLGGHGDLLAGAIVGPKAMMDEVRYFGLKDMTGAVLSAQDAHLVLRGLKTLAVRMDRHCDNAEKVVAFLSKHPKVTHIDFPGHPQASGFCVAQRQMKRPGAMLSIEVTGGYEGGKRMLNALEIFTRAVSLGDCESLAQHPASMTHSFYSREEREAHLISEGLVRLSVGLEDAEDLIADLDHALAAV